MMFLQDCVSEGDTNKTPPDMLQMLESDVADMCAVLVDMGVDISQICIIAGDMDGELSWESWSYQDMVDNEGVEEVAESLEPLRSEGFIPVWFWTKDCDRDVFKMRLVWTTQESDGVASC